MEDKDLQIEASYHLEEACDLLGEAKHLDMDGCDIHTISTDYFRELRDRLTAALYMVQAMRGGPRPANFDEVVTLARDHDATIAAQDLIARAKGEF